MIVLAILATLASLAFSIVVLFANAMSDNVDMAFQGGWMVAGAWPVVVALWVGWYVG